MVSMALLMMLAVSRRSALTHQHQTIRRQLVRRNVSLNPDSNNNGNIITSTKSRTVQRIVSLAKRKKRKEYGETIVEGPKLVFDLLANEKTRDLVDQVIISTDKWDEFYSQLLDLSNDGDLPPILPATSPVFKYCSDTVTPQGILAITRIPHLGLHSSVTSMPQKAGKGLFLILDGVSDPGNVGTLIRSGLATGVAGILLLPGSCDPWSPKAIRSGMGATFQLPFIHSCSDWKECHELLMNELHCSDDSIWAATMLDGIKGKSHFDVAWVGDKNSAVIIGSEGQGLSETIREHPGLQSVYVPMQEGIESLNAAVCGSVIMFEFMRQRNLPCTT